MLTRKTLVLVTCIIVLLTISGTAWGDTGKPKPSEQLEIKQPGNYALEQNRAVLAKAPWPTAYGKADRAMCSDSKGPGGVIATLTGKDIFTLIMLGYDRGPSEFPGILIGPGNIAYIHHYREGKSTIHAYSLESGFLWDAQIKIRTNFCLDTSGRVYTLESYGQPYESRYEVVCRTSSGAIVWNYRFGPSLTIDILTVGKHVYVVDRGNQEFFITAINLDGTKAWSKGPYEPWAWPKCAADVQGNLYMKFDRRNMGVWKFDDEGDIQWKVPLNYRGASPLASSASEQVGLMCVDDGRVLVDDLEHHYTTDDYNADPYLVINPDGTIFKSGNLGEGTKSTMACYGSDGRLYVATIDNKIKCFNNWNQQVWVTQLPFGNLSQDGEITAMILDSENIVYSVYALGKMRVLYMLDPSNGEMLGAKTIELPNQNAENLGDKDFLAIGDDELLIWFNSKGSLRVYEATMEDLPITWEAEDLDIHLEVIEKNGDD